MRNQARRTYKAVAIGTSAGGLNVLSELLSALPQGYQVPIIIVQHRAKEQQNLLEEILQQKCRIPVKQAEEKEKVAPGLVFIAPPDYHLLIEADETFSLSCEERVQYSRPSVDVLFETAADAFGAQLAAIVLTGFGMDGAAGIAAVNASGGVTIAQNPKEAAHADMPEAAVKNGATHIYTLKQIKDFLLGLAYSHDEL
ncbi:MAG: chemotaxis protein CheB [Agriterribacter sp.]